MSGIWIDDGSKSITSDGLTATCNKVTYGTPSNALFEGYELTSGQSYWSFTFAEVEEHENPFVGLTSEAKFGPGWGMKGYMYGGPGNLSSGGAALAIGFGESIKSGDTIGILAEAEPNRLKIYYFHNGSALGLAFDLPAPYLNPLYPCVRFNGKSQITIKKEDVIPNQKDRKNEYDPDSIVGCWGLVSPKGSATITIRAGETSDKYSASLHIINHIQVRISTEGQNCVVTIGASTRMGGTKEMMAFEHFLSALVKSSKSVALENDQLVLRGDKDVIWTKTKVKEFEPVTYFDS